MTMHLLMGRWFLIVGVTCLAFGASPGGVIAARPSCLPGCDPTQPTADCCPACVTTACSQVEDCIVGFDDSFGECVSKIEPIGGHCQLTRDLLQECRNRRAAWNAACRRSLRHLVQAGCGEAAGVACHIGRRAARRACSACGAAVTPSNAAAATVTTLPASRALAAGDVDCQERCIRRVAKSCYDDCADACEGDAVALAICQQGCRTDQCTALRAACTDNTSAAADQYRFCCGTNCADEVDCVVTTTTTKTTTKTTTTSGSTTTTTL